jgi:orotate phosphoribosyltransferase
MNKPHPIITSLYQIGAIQFGEFTLKSGLTSPIYLNLRKIISYPDLLRTIAEAMWEKTQACEYDLVCGVPYTALPIATCLSLDHHIPMIMRRKEKKDYGTKQSIEGEFKVGQHCLIIEDVVTTGGSIIETATELENSGLQINDLVALIDREQGGKETLNKKYRLHTLFSLSEILHALLTSTFLNAKESSIIEQLLKEKSAT